MDDARARGGCHHICSFPGCSKTFSRPDRLIIHFRTHTGEKPYFCEEEGCTKEYARASHLKRHHEKCHAETKNTQKIRCREPDCVELFSSHCALKKHIKRIHQSRQYKCPHEGCTKSFIKHQHLKVHQFEHTAINPFRCPVEGCHMTCKLPSKLKRHMKVHAGYPCSEDGCDAILPTWTKLRKHKTEQHSAGHVCKTCGKTFSQKQWLHYHMKTHKEERESYLCPHEGCTHSYLDKRNLKIHIQSKHEGQKFICDHCQSQFSSKQKLKQHSKRHEANWINPKQKPRLNLSKKKTTLEKIMGVDRKTMEMLEEDRSEMISIEDISDMNIDGKSENTFDMAEVNCENEDKNSCRILSKGENSKLGSESTECSQMINPGDNESSNIVLSKLAPTTHDEGQSLDYLISSTYCRPFSKSSECLPVQEVT